MTAPDGQAGSGYHRVGHMALAVTIGVSVAGFLIGVRERPQPDGSPAGSNDRIERGEGRYPEVVDYMRMAETRRGPNASWKHTLLPYEDNPAAFFGAEPPTTEQRNWAIASRSERRAFSGAPPVVPHAIDERNAQACLACHGAGLKVGQIVAPRMSHHYLANCTQCHVEALQNAPLGVSPSQLALSSFNGLPEPGQGERIGPGAPPTIPHALWMRSECAACHGSLGKDGLRSSHPWRTNCTQCHAPSREFDWAPMEMPIRKPPGKQEKNSASAFAKATAP